MSYRSGLALSLSRHKNEAQLLEEEAEKFLETDKLENFDDLSSGLSNEQFPQSFFKHQKESGVNLICLSQEQPPTISGTILIAKQLKVHLYFEQQILPYTSYKHIVGTDGVFFLSR